MEVSSDPSRLDLKDAHARRAKELGVKLVISTDAHWAGQLSAIRFGLATARRGWVEASDVLNAQPLAALRKSLRRARAKPLAGGRRRTRAGS
jgi:DNA polymerase (family 10)